MQCTECLNTVQDERILSSPGITGVSNDTGIPGFCSSFIRRCPKCGDLARSLEKPCGPLERGGHPMRQTECFCRRAAPLTAALPPSRWLSCSHHMLVIRKERGGRGTSWPHSPWRRSQACRTHIILVVKSICSALLAARPTSGMQAGRPLWSHLDGIIAVAMAKQAGARFSPSPLSYPGRRNN